MGPGPLAPAGTGTELVLDSPRDTGWPCPQLLEWGQARGVPEGPVRGWGWGEGLGALASLGLWDAWHTASSLRGVILLVPPPQAHVPLKSPIQFPFCDLNP